MNFENFCYWLRGFFELTEAELGEGSFRQLTPDQQLMIKKHLELVFTPVTKNLNELQPSQDDSDLIKELTRQDYLNLKRLPVTAPFGEVKCSPDGISDC